MKFGAQRPSGRLISLTPLIDAVFILLVFFMLAASFLDWRAVDLNVTSGVDTASSADRAILIDLAADGSAVVDAVAVSDGAGDVSALGSAIATRLSENGEQRVVIRSQPGVALQRAIDTLDLVRALGATNVSLARRR